MKNVLWLTFVLAACGPNTRPLWSAYGSDVLGCAAPAIAGTVEAGVGELVALAAGKASADDWKGIGSNLLGRYGAPLAICVVEAAFRRFSGNVLPAEAPPVALAAAWLRAHKAEWLPVVTKLSPVYLPLALHGVEQAAVRE